tara:strand:- start:2893 stop:3483 length:591 start_codon:yes stop_codon:yes gene_type:complete
MIGFEVNNERKMHDLLYELGANADKAISIALLRCAQHAEGEIKRVAQKTFKPGTGNLMRSFKAQMLDKKGSTLSAGALSDLVYAGIQNEGGTIRSSRGPNKYLAIPMPNRDIPLGKWPRDYPRGALHVGIAPIPYRLGLVLMDSTGQVMFNLAKEVKLKPKKYIEEAQEKSSKEWPRIFNERLAELADAAQTKASK